MKVTIGGHEYKAEGGTDTSQHGVPYTWYTVNGIEFAGPVSGGEADVSLHLYTKTATLVVEGFIDMSDTLGNDLTATKRMPVAEWNWSIPAALIQERMGRITGEQREE